MMRIKEDYIIISPVKDEERYLETTIQAVANQTRRPLRWLIVDDGSTDRTPEIIREYVSKFDWIEMLRIDRNGTRNLGSAEIQAFAAGYRGIRDCGFDYVVKLDCDLDLGPRYFEMLLEEFRQDRSLGIASGIYLEQEPGGWKPVRMPWYHAAGAAKMVRRDCYEKIGGFILAPGWDTVDEIRARMAGWQTCHFPAIQFYHLKKEGSAMGPARMNLFHGRIYYLTGGGFTFFAAKAAARAFSTRPVLLSGFLMLAGYAGAWLARTPRSVSSEEARFYRKMLNGRFLDACGGFFRKSALQGKARQA